MLAAGTRVSSYWHSSSRNDTVEISNHTDVLRASLELQKTRVRERGEGAAPAHRYCKAGIKGVLSCSNVVIKGGGGGRLLKAMTFQAGPVSQMR